MRGDGSAEEQEIADFGVCNISHHMFNFLILLISARFGQLARSHGRPYPNPFEPL